MLLESLSKLDLIKFISKKLELRCGWYWFLSGFVARNSNKLQKLGLEGKMSWVLNVFIVGPMAYVLTIVLYNLCI
jgi:hypothetical protein